MGQTAGNDEVVMSVRQRADGYWYIGQGRSIAEGPYRHPQQLLAVASDLLSAHAHWRIDVFDQQGTKIVSYGRGDLDPGMLHPLRGRGLEWHSLSITRGARH